MKLHFLNHVHSYLQYQREHGWKAFFKLLRYRIRQVVQYGREQGLRVLWAKILRKCKESSPSVSNEDLNFVLYQPVGKPFVQGECATNTINWFIPPCGKGSGGHLNIFRFILNLEKSGFECRIIIIGDTLSKSALQIEKEIKEQFFPIAAKVYLGIEQAPPAHISMATAWHTAYAVRNFQSTLHRCYFVQDFEPWFYASGSQSVLAEQTYKFGFVGITAGNWLSDKLKNDYGMKTFAVSFSYDRHYYRVCHRREPSVRKLFFYVRPTTPRRGFELGMLVLNKVHQQYPDVEFILAGWDISYCDVPFKYTNPGVVKVSELAELYSQCDLALVLSFSNLSLLPLELMACGVPVVSNKAPYTEWLLNAENACLAEPTVENLSEAICKLLENEDERKRLSARGLVTANNSCWEKEGEKLAGFLSTLT